MPTIPHMFVWIHSSSALSPNGAFCAILADLYFVNGQYTISAHNGITVTNADGTRYANGVTIFGGISNNGTCIMVDPTWSGYNSGSGYAPFTGTYSAVGSNILEAVQNFSLLPVF